MHIIDQNLEGELAFQAVLSKIDVAPEDLVVWDIGGGERFGIYWHGSVMVLLWLIVERRVWARLMIILLAISMPEIPENIRLPNPMSVSDISQAEIYAKNLSQGVNEFFQKNSVILQ